MKPEMFKVVTGVDDDGQFLWGKDLGKAMRKFRAAYAACQCYDLHEVDSIVFFALYLGDYSTE